MKEPKVHVGILSEPQIEFNLPNPYRIGGTEASGRQTVAYDEGKILWNGRRYDELLFEPQNESTDAFELPGVTIGIDFHWERKEDQRFLGALKIIVEDGKLTAIDVVKVEDYLTSVISSEMSATASLELLKAHAVISRSWLLAQIQKNREIAEAKTDYSAFTQTEEELIRWYDREDHTRFDVCADDHCQRYQGITRLDRNRETSHCRNLRTDTYVRRKNLRCTLLQMLRRRSRNSNTVGKTRSIPILPNNGITA